MAVVSVKSGGVGFGLGCGCCWWVWLSWFWKGGSVEGLAVGVLAELPAECIAAKLMLVITLFVCKVLNSCFVVRLGFVSSVCCSVVAVTAINCKSCAPRAKVRGVFTAALTLSNITLLTCMFGVVLADFRRGVDACSGKTEGVGTVSSVSSCCVVYKFNEIKGMIFSRLGGEGRGVVMVRGGTRVLRGVRRDDSMIAVRGSTDRSGVVSGLTNRGYGYMVMDANSSMGGLFVILAVHRAGPST